MTLSFANEHSISKRSRKNVPCKSIALGIHRETGQEKTSSKLKVKIL